MNNLKTRKFKDESPKFYTLLNFEVPKKLNDRRMAVVQNVPRLQQLKKCQTCKYANRRQVELIIVNNEQIYKMQRGNVWAWSYVCPFCQKHCGIHPYTDLPLGVIADAATRYCRKKAKIVFNKLWQQDYRNISQRILTRDKAYELLASALNISENDWHFGMFDKEQSEKSYRSCKNLLCHQGGLYFE